MFFPEYESAYPYTEEGKLPGDPEGVLDPFTALTFVAANTETLRLGTGICLVPQRQAVYTAKMVADLDYLSGGRVDFGVGIGWLKEEFENLQMPWAGRGRRTLEYLEVMQALWQPGLASYSGEAGDAFEFDGFEALQDMRIGMVRGYALPPTDAPLQNGGVSLGNLLQSDALKTCCSSVKRQSGS